MTALEYATDRKAEVVGKPEKTFFLSAVSEFNCEPHNCVMIGDVSLIYDTYFSLGVGAFVIRLNQISSLFSYDNLEVFSIFHFNFKFQFDPAECHIEVILSTVLM